MLKINLKEFWGKLPKTVKVFCYISISILLSEGLIELKGLDSTFAIRSLAGIINIVLVLLEESVPAIRNKLTTTK